MRPAAIFDMDGTLVDVSNIRHLVTSAHRDFDAFHQASLSSPARPWVVDLAREAVLSGLAVIVVTARQDRYRFITTTWLHEHCVPYDRLLMRSRFDTRPDAHVKADILHRIQHRYDVHFAVDDNPSVINLWRSRGTNVITVPGWPLPLVKGQPRHD